MRECIVLFPFFLFFLTAFEGSFELPEGFHNNGQRGPGSETNNLRYNNSNGEIWYIQHCWTCHGSDATSTIWENSIEAYDPIRKIVLEGRGTMPAIAISVEATDKIQTYLLTLGVTNDMLDGEGLYNRFCSSCHGANATSAEN